MKKFFALLMVCMLLMGTSALADYTTEATYVGTDGPIVTTTGGDVLGYKVDGTYRFLGIPYAHAARFAQPEPASWQGVFTANVYGTVCPIEGDDSLNFTEFITPSAVTNQIKNEDCMNLNVWTQALGEDAKKPVVVWIHGGGFASGSSTELKFYEGQNLSQFGDVVVVSLNHRLNVLGFMDLSAYGEQWQNSGNAGMADIVTALDWVHNNVAAFGGDPQNVTIIGQSGGGAKVTTLCGLPSAQGLFQKAICQSGGVSGNDPAQAQAVAAKTMETLGCTTVEELQLVKYDDLIAAASAACGELGYSWGPVVDGTFYPAPSVVDGKFSDYGKDVTMMVSTTLGEFSGNSVMLSKGFPGDYRSASLTEEEVMERLTATYGDAAQSILDAFKVAYPDHPVGDSLWFDTGFFAQAADIVAAKAAQAAEGGAPVYQYMFAQDYKAYGGCVPPHCAEIPFFMHNVEMIPELTYDAPEAYALEETISTAYVNFARTGDPSQDGLAWTPFTTEAPAVMVFDTASRMTGTEIYDLATAALNAGSANSLDGLIEAVDSKSGE